MMLSPDLEVSVPKTRGGYDRVQRAILRLRRDGVIAYRDIVDPARWAYHHPGYRDRAEFVRAVSGLYRQDLWSHAEARVEVWCESQGTTGALRPLCSELGVSLYPTRGYPSDSFLHGAAEEAHGETALHIVYVGDHDPHGVNIERTTYDRLAEMLPGTALALQRVAVTAAQIEAHGLPTRPRKPGDKVAPDITGAVELEALPPNALRAAVRTAVEAHLDAHELAVLKEAEADERQALKLWKAA